MIRSFPILLLIAALLPAFAGAQPPKVLFDNTLNETAGNADWIIDVQQPVPVPAQSGITPATPETYWLGAISAWGVELAKRGCIVHTLTSTYGITYGNAGNLYDLSNYDLFVVCEPQNPFTAAEKTAIRSFVQNGGGLLMVADHNASDRDGDGWDSPEVWNDMGIDASFGLHFQSNSESDNSFTEVSSNLATAPSDSIIRGAAGTVTALSYHAGTSIRLLTANNPTAAGHVWMTGAAQGSTKIMAATAHYGNGRVGAIGDSSPADDGTGQSGNTLYNGWTEAGATDDILFLNMSLWLAAGGAPSPPAAAVLKAPSAGATGVPVPASCIWYRTTTADRYHIQVSPSGSFTSMVVDDSTATDTLRAVSGLLLNTPYSWRVRAHNAGGWGPYSTAWSFTTWAVPAQTLLLNPADGETGTALPTVFSWQAVSGAVRYHFVLDTSSVFAAPLISDTSITGVSTIRDALLSGEQYFWKVRAGNAAGWGDYSAARSFTTLAAPSIVQPVLPADSAVDVPVPALLTWNPLPGTARYRVDIAATPLFAVLLFTDSLVTDSLRLVPGLPAGVDCFWRVRARNSAGWGPYSMTRLFTTWSAPQQVGLLNPPDAAVGTGDPVLCLWQPAAGADRYHLQVSASPSFASPVISDSTLVDTTRSLTGIDTLTTFSWRVRAHNAAGWGPFSEARTFRMAAALRVSLPIAPGWHMISLPVLPADLRAVVLFPDAGSAFFAYDNGYAARETLAVGPGYWARFNTSGTLTVTGEPLGSDTVDVRAGWNLVGSLSGPVPAGEVASIPPGIIAPPFYAFGDGYAEAPVLEPMKGYWIRCTAPGKIILRLPALRPAR